MGLVKRDQKKQSADMVGERRKRIRDFVGLVKGLSDPDPTVRRWCARDLAVFSEASKHLVEQLKKEEDKSVKEVIVTTLIRIGNKEAVQGLIECLRSDDAHLRNASIEALKHLPHKVSPVMEQLLKDKDPDIRIFAINILESLKDERVEDWLIYVIENDPHINVCGTALDLLTEVGTEKALPSIAKVKERFNNPYINYVADIAVRRIRGAEENE